MPCPFCDAPLLGNPRVCPDCGKPLPTAAHAAEDADPFSLLDAPGQPASAVRAGFDYRPVTLPGDDGRAAAPTGAPTSMPPFPAKLVTAPAPAALPAIPAAALPAVPPKPAAPTRPAAPPRPAAPAGPPDPILAVLERNTREDIGEVQVDPVPGMIDSRLFGAYMPAQIETPQLDGLENLETKKIDIPVDNVPDRQSHRYSEMPPVGPNLVVPGEVQVPGMIDQRLFGAFVPANLETPAMDDIQYTRFEDLIEHDAGAEIARPAQQEIPLGTCAACGVQFRSRACPECGNPMIVKPAE